MQEPIGDHFIAARLEDGNPAAKSQTEIQEPPEAVLGRIKFVNLSYKTREEVKGKLQKVIKTEENLFRTEDSVCSGDLGAFVALLKKFEIDFEGPRQNPLPYQENAPDSHKLVFRSLRYPGSIVCDGSILAKLKEHGLDAEVKTPMSSLIESKPRNIPEVPAPPKAEAVQDKKKRLLQRVFKL